MPSDSLGLESPRVARRAARSSASAALKGRFAEEAELLRTNLETSLADLDRPSIMVTSTLPGEGRTTVAANLARSLALAGRRVVLVDLDLRQPGIHDQVGVPNDIGVVDVILGDRSADACLRFVTLDAGSDGGPSGGLYVLTAGRIERNPREIIGGKRTRNLLRALEAEADVVLVDGPSVLGNADATLIGRLVGGTLLVVESGRTPTTRVEQAKTELMGHQVRLLGVVLNKTRALSR